MTTVALWWLGLRWPVRLTTSCFCGVTAPTSNFGIRLSLRASALYAYRQAGAETMPDVKAAFVECEPEDEHILRRLGGAVVVQWPDLPEAVRQLLVEQATFVHDRQDTVQL